VTTANLTDEKKSEVREWARGEYGSDNVEIDTDAAVFKSDDDGYWVAAWVFVRDEGEE